MTPRTWNFALLATRLLAVFIAVWSLPPVVDAIYPLVVSGGNFRPDSRLFIYLATDLVPIVVAPFLWVFAGRFARLLTKGSVAERVPTSEEVAVPDESVTITPLTRVGVALVGVWFAVNSLSKTIYNFTAWKSLARIPGFAKSQYVGATLANVVQVVLGLVLIFNARRFAEFMTSRRAPTNEVESDPSPSVNEGGWFSLDDD